MKYEVFNIFHFEILVLVDLNLLFLFVFLSIWEYELVGRKNNHFSFWVLCVKTGWNSVVTWCWWFYSSLISFMYPSSSRRIVRSGLVLSCMPIYALWRPEFEFPNDYALSFIAEIFIIALIKKPEAFCYGWLK